MLQPTPLTALHKDVDTHLAVFDTEALGALFDHDTRVIASVLRTFVSSITMSLSQLDLAVAAQDFAGVGALAHKIKGASRLSGAHALGSIAANLEHRALLADLTGVEDTAQKLQAQWLLVRSLIDK